MDGAMEEAFAVKHLVGADADAVGAEAALLTSVAYQNPSKVLVRTRHADVHLNVKVIGFGQLHVVRGGEDGGRPVLTQQASKERNR